MGLPLLLGAMNNKASKPEGANAIMGSLAKAGSNNPMDSMASYISGSGSSQESDMLSSILGSSLQPIQQAISKSTGLPSGVVGKLLSMALPLVLGSVSKSSPSKTWDRMIFQSCRESNPKWHCPLRLMQQEQ